MIIFKHIIVKLNIGFILLIVFQPTNENKLYTDLVKQYLLQNRCSYAFISDLKDIQKHVYNKLLNVWISPLTLNNVTFTYLLRLNKKTCLITELISLESIIINDYLLSEEYNWLVHTNKSNWLHTLEVLNTRMDSNIIIAEEFQEKFILYSVYSIGREKRLKINTVGFYQNDCLTLIKPTMGYTDKLNMSGATIKSGNVINGCSLSFQECILDSKHKEINTISKIHYQIFLLLQEIHFFDFEVILSNAWFGNSFYGTDAGVAKLLYNNEIDITSTGGLMRAVRVNYIDYMMTTHKFIPSFIFRNPESNKRISNEIVKPFSVYVWYLVIITAIIISLCIKLVYKVEHTYFKNSINYSGFTTLLLVHGGLTQQGLFTIPHITAGKIIILSLLILSIIIYNYYTSNIVSLLLSKQPEVLRSIRELAESDLEVAMEKQPYTITYLLLTNITDDVLLNKTKLLSNGNFKFVTAHDGISKVRQGGFAYHTETTTAYALIIKTFEPYAICDLVEIPLIPEGDVSFMAVKHSQYREMFQISLRKMKEHGIIHRLNALWVTKKPPCQSSSLVLSVGINQVFMVFLILMFGTLIAVTLLILEIIWNKKYVGNDFC